MPLILVCGYPCSGKSTVTDLLASIFTETNQRDRLLPSLPLLTDATNISAVHVVRDPESHPRNVLYASSTEEKKTRAKLKAQVERLLHPHTLVICDSLNYIKGFRYELYCIAKLVGTQMITVYCRVTKDVAIQRNQQRQEKSMDALDVKLLEQLMQRFEVPQQKNRWEAPLFLADPTDIPQNLLDPNAHDDLKNTATGIAHPMQATASIPNPAIKPTPSSTSHTMTVNKEEEKEEKVKEEEKDPCCPSDRESSHCPPSIGSWPTTAAIQEISTSDFRLDWDNLIGAVIDPSKRLRPSMGVVPTPHGTANALGFLDHVTRQVELAVLEYESTAPQHIPVPYTKKVMVELKGRAIGSAAVSGAKAITPAELRRIRRAYLKFAQMHPPSDDLTQEELVIIYVNYLNSQLANAR